MSNNEPLQSFVLLPGAGLRASSSVSTAWVDNWQPSRPSGAEPAVGTHVRVVDSIREGGAKLVELSDYGVGLLRAEHPELRIVPVLYYRTAKLRFVRAQAEPMAQISEGTRVIRIRITDKRGLPIHGAKVAAFTNFAAREGDNGIADADGVATVVLPSSAQSIEHLYVYPTKDYWPLVARGVSPNSEVEIILQAIRPQYVDGLKHFFGSTASSLGGAVTVGIIDSGIDFRHPALMVSGGENTVVGEPPNDYGDNGTQHGTHVAGIVGANQQVKLGMRGVAPGATLRSYRVFARDTEIASSYSIAKAIDHAVSDGCDLLNLSLSGVSPDPTIEAAITEAHTHGSVMIAAAGNDNRGPVGYPASLDVVIAVSAMGRQGTFPKDSTHSAAVARPLGTDARNFVAAFTNVGGSATKCFPVV